jgi:hypothetical protein
MAEPLRDQPGRPVDPTPATSTHLRPVTHVDDTTHIHDRHPDEIHHVIPEAYNLRHDRVRLGPIVAGFVTAVTAMALLGMLGLAIGMTSVDAAFDASRGAPPPDVQRNAAIWAGLSSIIAFLIGGFVAGRSSAVFDRGWGTLNGMLVFLFAVPVMLWLAGQGFGAMLGTIGNFASGLQVDPNTVNQAANQAAQSAQGTTVTVSPADVSRAAEAARNAAWAGLLGSLLALGAAALGGAMGTRRELTHELDTGDLHE